MALERVRSEDILQQVPAEQWAHLIRPAVQSHTHGDHLVPSSMEKTLVTVAASLMHSFSGVSKWSITELTLGLYKLSGRHSLEGAVDTISGFPVSNMAELEAMLEWIHWAMAAYKPDRLALADALKIREEDVVKMVSTSAVMKPAFFVALHHLRRCVVMGIRGTYTATDLLTDLNPHSEPFKGGYAHSGMLVAARWLLENEGQTLRDYLQSNRGYALVLTGHSLGASTAFLLSMLLRETADGRFSKTLGIPPEMVICWGFGCPPCVDRTLAEPANFTYNVVLQDDVVARVSPAAFEGLRSEIVQTEWSQAFKEGPAKKVVEVLQQVELPPGMVEAYNRVKEHSYTALVTATSTLFSRFARVRAGELGSAAKTAADYLTFGATVANDALKAASNQVSSNVDKSLTAIAEKNGEKRDEGVAAAAVSVNAIATVGTSRSREDLEKQRHFVPGILYHIIRQPLQPGQELPVPAAPSKEGQEPHRPSRVRHVVVRGTDPSSRFGRIVLSNTMLTDHSCSNYIDGMLDALSWARTGRRVF